MKNQSHGPEPVGLCYTGQVRCGCSHLILLSGIVPLAIVSLAANAVMLRESIMQRVSIKAANFLIFMFYPSSVIAVMVKTIVAALMFVAASLAETFAL